MKNKLNYKLLVLNQICSKLPDGVKRSLVAVVLAGGASFVASPASAQITEPTFDNASSINVAGIIDVAQETVQSQGFVGLSALGIATALHVGSMILRKF